MQSQRPIQSEAAIKKWVRNLIRSLARLFGRGGHGYRVPTVEASYYGSEKYVLRLLVRDSERNICTWLRLSRQDQGYDVLITLDSLEVRREEPVFRGFVGATHRVAVVKLNTIPNKNGSRHGRCVFLADFDFVGVSGLAWGAGDRFARIIVKALALQITKSPYDELAFDWVAQIDFYAKQFIGQLHTVQAPPDYYTPPPMPPDGTFILSLMMVILPGAALATSSAVLLFGALFNGIV